MAGKRAVPWVIGLVVLGAALATYPGTGGSSAATTGSTSTDMTPMPPVTVLGTLDASVGVTTAKLVFRGTRVTSLRAGKYRVLITDSSSKAGFELQRIGLAVKSLTGGPFVGRHTVVLVLAAGKWKYYASTHAASAGVFTVTAAK